MAKPVGWRSSPTEHWIQSKFFDWARLHPIASRAYAIPNGGKRNRTEAARLKSEGVRAGVLDVHLPVPRGGCNGLWIEFKSLSGALSPEQRDEIPALVADGFAVAVMRDPFEAIELTERYLKGEVSPGLVP